VKFMLFLTLATAAPLAAQSTAPAANDAVLLKRGHDLTEWLFAGQADSILAYMAEDTRQQVGGKDGLLKTTRDIAFDVGAEAEIVEEKMTRRKGHPQYWRKGKYATFVREPMVFRWVFDDAGQVIGLGITPMSQTPPVD